IQLGMRQNEAVEFALAQFDYLLSTQTSPDETAAVVVEPVLGEGGYVPAPAAFLNGLAKRSREIGALFVADEVQTGFARTGRFWAVDHCGLIPDVLITAKGLASGFPLSAFAASTDLMSRAWPGSQGGTYGGNAVACAAAVATLDVIRDEGLEDNAAERGVQLLSLLDD
ncbi:MAG: aminotransferase class III-fold pyridoxal phosphate-dependent enzyme, partial [Actinomycetia bacterium]|nr:aminotransferase class III-fold pyridoxal phosphate-dependent enzyme [Actinomycetes bacterium]